MSCTLTAADYWEAMHAIHDRVLGMRRDLKLMGEFCPPDYRVELNSRIDAELEREARFTQAAISAQHIEEQR